MKLSYSAVSRFSMCPKSYKYHYIDRIRPKFSSAALFFGSAFDNAVNSLLFGKTLDEAKKVFLLSFTNGKINSNQEFLPTSEKLVYASTDFDKDLISEKEEKLFFQEFNENIYNIYETLKTQKSQKGFDNFSNKEKQMYNYANWLSLKVKGKLMLDAYVNKILPNIKKIHAVQKYISLTNEDGDSLIGYVDLIAEWIDGKIVIFDLKTSSMDYENDAVLNSPQLSLYKAALENEFNTKHAGYIVFKKQVKKNRQKTCKICHTKADDGSRHKTCAALDLAGKRCGGEFEEILNPEVIVQILIDEIPDRAEEIVLENFNEINACIKNGVFPRNFSTCNNVYGGPCPYKNKCWKNNEKGLEKITEEK